MSMTYWRIKAEFPKEKSKEVYEVFETHNINIDERDEDYIACEICLKDMDMCLKYNRTVAYAIIQELKKLGVEAQIEAYTILTLFRYSTSGEEVD